MKVAQKDYFHAAISNHLSEMQKNMSCFIYTGLTYVGTDQPIPNMTKIL